MVGLLLAALCLPLAAAPAQGVTAEEETPLTLAVVVPVTVPLDAPPILDAASLARWTAPNGFLTTRLDAVTGTAATLAVDPRIGVSIRLLGSAAPASAVDWLARLESLPNDAFALAYADADRAGLAEQGRDDLAAPLGFGFAIQPDRFAPIPGPTAGTPSPTTTTEPEATAVPEPNPTGPPGPDPSPAPPTPSPTPPDPDQPTAPPTDEELLADRFALSGIVWASPGTVTADGAAALADAGVEHLLLPSEELSRGGHVRLDELTALGVDTELSALASSAAASAGLSDFTRDRLLVSLSGYEPAAGAVVLSTGRAVTEEPGSLSALLDLLADESGLALTGLGTILTSPTARGALVPAPDDDRARLVADMAEASDAEAPISTVVADPEAFLAERRLELLAALAAGRVGDPPLAEEAYLEGSAAVAGAVRIAISSSDLLVLSSSTGLPVTISNALDVPATVRLWARPLRPLLRIRDVPMTVTVEPDSSRTVYLPAEAVTNGRVAVLLELSSSTAETIGPERRINVDLHAEWETIGIIILVIVGLAFAGGVVRNIVVRRLRSRRDRDSGAPAESEATSGASDVHG